jgi:cobalamin biosynthesis protein CobD/CbiB
MVGKRAVKSEHIIEFIAARLPTLQIWVEKIVKIPKQTHSRCQPKSDESFNSSCSNSLIDSNKAL